MGRKEIIKFDLNSDLIQRGLANLPGGFFIYQADGDCDILYANEAVMDIFECKTAVEFMNLTGGTFEGMIYLKDKEDVRRRIKSQILSDDGNFDQISFRIITQEANVIYVQIYGKCIDDPEYGKLLHVFMTTVRTRLDGLTGLQNGWYFLETASEGLDKMYKSGRNPVILSFDFIGMKGFNSKYGRESGDGLLVEFAEIISEELGGHNCSRFGEDRFYGYTDTKNIEMKLNNIIVAFHQSNNSNSLPVKIGICKYIDGVSVSTLCDWAKVACDANKNRYASGFSWFDDNMAKNFDKTEYILSQLDRAILDGSIQVYFQPVVRAMTGKLASFEALVRWQDKRYGMISSGEFIPVLEENGLSYKIDRCVANQVAKLISEKIKAGKEIVPVSVNISRTDFDVIDPVEMLIDAVDEYEIPRNMIPVEITETTVISDNGITRDAIERFHKAGFQVWMDDFGSGYSSLNVLKDYNFDEIKIDMIFMRNFDERSKSIVKLAVKMAKELGIHTLAEGVETEEQLEFLRSIGCEKIQGYFYGKPLPFDEAMVNISDRMIAQETRSQASFYDQVGLAELPEDVPAALFYYDCNSFTMVYQNDKYRDVVTKLGDNGVEVIEWDMNSSESALSSKFKNLADRAIETGKVENMTFVNNDKYYYFTFKKVVARKGEAMLSAFVAETEISEVERLEELDAVIRNLTTLFDGIYLIDLDRDEWKVVYSIWLNETVGEANSGVEDFYEKYNVRRMYFDDIDRFRNEFVNNISFEKHLSDAARGSFCEEFRIKDESGNYVWTEFNVVALPESGGNRYLLCIRPAFIEGQQDKMAAINRLVNNMTYRYSSDDDKSYFDVWQALLRNSNIKMFWKDKDRRFLGASQSFLDYYGFESEECILGKNDEEMGWHVNDKPFRDIEKDVIECGKKYINIAGENIVNGKMHNILASKFPVYKEGIITGLVGYFTDVDQDIADAGIKDSISIFDTETGFMNARGVLVAMIGYDNNYRSNQEDYIYIIVEIPEYEDINRTLGDDVIQLLTMRLADILRDTFRDNYTLGRVTNGSFAIAGRNVKSEEVQRLLRELEEHISTINSIDGNVVKVSMMYGLAYGSEFNDLNGVISLALDRLTENKNKINGEILLKGNEFKLDSFRDIPLPMVIVKPQFEQGEEAHLEPTDMTIVYVNKKYCELTGYNSKELVGKSCLKLFKNINSKWIDYAYRAARGEVISDNNYSMAFEAMVEFVAAPFSQAGSSVFIFKTIQDYTDKYLKREIDLNTYKIVDEMWIRVENVVAFEDVMNMTIKEIGEVLDADRVYILNNMGGGIKSRFEWAKDDVSAIDGFFSTADNELVEQFMSENLIDGYIRIDDIQDIREKYADLYNDLRAIGIYNVIMIPNYIAGNLVGYLCVDNYDKATKYNVELMLNTFSKFISAKMTKHEIYLNYGQVMGQEEKDKKIVTSEKEIADEVTKKIVDILRDTSEYEDSIMNSLREISKYITADRIYILEIDREIVNNTFEYCYDGAVSQKDTLQNLDYNVYYKPWEKMLQDNKIVIIENVQMLRHASPAVYVTTVRRGISRFMAVPFYNNGKIMGYLCVDNYDIKEYQKVKKILQTVSYVISAKVLSNYFQKINSFDDLTGVHNRNAMLTKKEEIKGTKKSVGIVFADMNGLKEVNDVQGHEAGDRYIQQTANIIADVYGADNIFRSGGDEFMVLLHGVDEKTFNDLRQKLLARFQEKDAPDVAVGFTWKEKMSDIDELISEADKLMYKDKSLFYAIHEKYRK
ncbi:MAG: EAL domain-containing protein [Lachnospiraceae bacterium]|nr:EAL domain-containing protein [Lachnospiraceae bacterium]